MQVDAGMVDGRWKMQGFNKAGIEVKVCGRE